MYRKDYSGSDFSPRVFHYAFKINQTNSGVHCAGLLVIGTVDFSSRISLKSDQVTLGRAAKVLSLVGIGGPILCFARSHSCYLRHTQLYTRTIYPLMSPEVTMIMVYGIHSTQIWNIRDSWILTIRYWYVSRHARWARDTYDISGSESHSPKSSQWRTTLLKWKIIAKRWIQWIAVN